MFQVSNYIWRTAAESHEDADTMSILCFAQPFKRNFGLWLREIEDIVKDVHVMMVVYEVPKQKFIA